MTLREIFNSLLNAFTDFVMHFLELFFWEIDWWDGNIFMLMLVLIAYFWIFTIIVQIIGAIFTGFVNACRYILDSEYRKKINAERKQKRDEERKEYKDAKEQEKKYIEERNKELDFWGRVKFFFQRSRILTGILLYLLFAIVLIGIGYFFDTQS